MRRRPATAVDDYDELDDQRGEPARPPVVHSGELARRPAGLPTVVDIEAGQRARMLPVTAAAVTTGVGSAAYCAAQAALSVGQPTVAAAIMTGACFGSFASVAALRLWFRDRIPVVWRGDVTSGLVFAATWASGAASIGPLTSAMPHALLGGTAWAARRWNTANEVHLPAVVEQAAIEPALEESESEPEMEPTDAASVLAKRWSERVAAGSKPVLRAAMLTSRNILPNAVTWIIDTDGDFTYDEMAKVRVTVAARLGISGANVVIEPIEDDESRGLLTIVTRDVLKAGVVYAGPRYEINDVDHTIQLAMAADGTGWLDHVVVDEVGVRPALLVGEPGSGKTATLEAITMGRLSSGMWEALFADGDPGGGSSPLLNEITDNFGAGPQAAMRVVEALEDIIEGRSRLKPALHETADGRIVTITDAATQKANVREMRPTSDYKGYVGVFDEFHRLSGDDWLKDSAQNFVKRVERILRIGRKYGVTLDVATQSLLADDYGNSTNLRGYLCARNAWIHRSGNKSEQHTINGVSLAPGSLPKRPGYAFAAGSGRLCLARVAWSKTMGEHATHFPRSPRDRRSELAVSRHRPRELDAAAALEDQLRLVDEWEAAMSAGRDPQALAPATDPAQSAQWKAGGVTVPAALTGKVLHFPTRQPEPAVSVDPAEVGKLSLIQSDALRVIAAVRGDTVRNADIRELHPEHAAPAVTQACQRLAALGYVVALDKQGRWKSTALGVAASAHLPIATTRPDRPAATQGSPT